MFGLFHNSGSSSPVSGTITQNYHGCQLEFASSDTSMITYFPTVADDEESDVESVKGPRRHREKEKESVGGLTTALMHEDDPSSELLVENGRKASYCELEKFLTSPLPLATT
ncbi:hypothetical protein AAF712_000688 [Marasmius tenuissimus]|uniref:Uncharacterized protein n=1 Tax=Marasmius tenuissimus TaxID=585030 RepID=A0ABR3ACU1_9AGAR